MMLLIATPLLLWACAGDPEPTLDEEVAEFAALTNIKPLVQACQELDKLCKGSGKGCKAYNLFCTQQGPGALFGDAGMPAPPAPPTPPSAGQTKDKIKQMICSNLKQACAMFPMACTIYNKHCGGATADAGPGALKPPLPGMPDFQLPKLPNMPDFQLPKLPSMPDFQLPKLPGFDKAKCCAALDTCIKNSDSTCAAAKTACMPQVQLPSMPQIPGMPGGGQMQLNLLKGIYKTLCSSP
jgi:hypothetical protein